MARPSMKEAILDAAEKIVLESGALRMTLDAVADRAKVSKGGLIYNFPTKEALLEAMINRLLKHSEQEREKARQKLPEGASPLQVEIKTLMELSGKDDRVGTALLAVNANQPELVDGFRENLRRRFADEIASPEKFDLSAILFSAALGLHLQKLLRISPLSEVQRKNVFEELLRLATSEGL